MLLPRRSPDHVAWVALDDRLTPLLYSSRAGNDHQRLAQRVAVPVRPRAWFERDSRAGDPGRLGRRIQRVDADRPGKVLSVPFAGRLGTASFDVHSRFLLF